MMLRHHAIALIVIACIAALIAAPLAMWISLPPPDVMDFERWGWCDGFLAFLVALFLLGFPFFIDSLCIMGDTACLVA